MPRTEDASRSASLGDAQALLRPGDATDSGDLAGCSGSGRDLEYPPHCSGVGWIPVPRQPSADRPTCERERGGGQGDCVGRVDGLGETVEEIIVIAQKVGSSGRQRDDVSVRDVIEEGEDFGANPVASKTGVGIGRILDRFEVERLAQRMRLCTPQAENGVAGARPDTGQSCGTGAAQEREEHRLDLIVGGVSEQCVGAHDALSHCASSGLQIRPVVEFGVLDSKRDTEPSCDRAGGRSVVVGGVTQTVMHVHRNDVESGRARKHRKRG